MTHSRAMKKCTSSLDRLSDLPSNITEIILICLPMRDSVRTSLLSRDWRLRWTKIPQLIFEDDPKMFRRQEDNEIYNLNIVFGILLQHQGPISKFKLDISSWCSYSGIDKIFQFLSRNGIKELNLDARIRQSHMLPVPSSIYSSVELTHLSLKSCSVIPLTLAGFQKLVTLELLNVKLDLYVTISGCPVLQYLIVVPLFFVISLKIECPNLKSLVVNRCRTCVCIKNAPNLKVLSITVVPIFRLEKESTLIKCLSSFPLLEYLSLSGYCVQSMARDSPYELPTTLEKIQMLRLTYIDFYDKDQLLFVLRLIRSSPNLQKLEIVERCQANQSQRQLSLQMPSSCNYCFAKLREVKFELRTDPRNYLEFCKFILAVSPELERLYIKPASRHIDLSCYKTLLKVACTRRASPKADIVFIGLDLDN